MQLNATQLPAPYREKMEEQLRATIYKNWAMIWSRATTEQIYVHVTKMGVTVKGRYEERRVSPSSEEELTINSQLTQTAVKTLLDIYTSTRSLQTHRCGLVAVPHPLIFCFPSFRKPSSMLIHNYPSTHPSFFFHHIHLPDLTQSYPRSLWGNGSCSFHYWGCPNAQILLLMTTKHKVTAQHMAGCTDVFLLQARTWVFLKFETGLMALIGGYWESSMTNFSHIVAGSSGESTVSCIMIFFFFYFYPTVPCKKSWKSQYCWRWQLSFKDLACFSTASPVFHSVTLF